MNFCCDVVILLHHGLWVIVLCRNRECTFKTRRYVFGPDSIQYYKWPNVALNSNVVRKPWGQPFKVQLKATQNYTRQHRSVFNVKVSIFPKQICLYVTVVKFWLMTGCRQYMRVRARVVEPQLCDWTVDTTMHSARQTDCSSCGCFLLMVSHVSFCWYSFCQSFFLAYRSFSAFIINHWITTLMKKK